LTGFKLDLATTRSEAAARRQQAHARVGESCVAVMATGTAWVLLGPGTLRSTMNRVITNYVPSVWWVCQVGVVVSPSVTSIGNYEKK
jgi:hypothetical protein